jgi:hypothetical protein
VTDWHVDFIQQISMLPMQQLDQNFGLSGLTDWPNAHGLNDLKSRNGNVAIPEFVCQNQLTESAYYYEQIIHQQNIIPTRPESWHDLFNGLIWLQFPKIKRLLNQQHIEDIQAHGLTPRTTRRNNLTHFDECGVILTYQSGSMAEQLIKKLAKHQWHSVFVENRQAWGKELNSFIFGHANLEMLLQPFIGLTGKWLALEVDSQFSKLNYIEQIKQIDNVLVNHIKQSDFFAKKKSMYPIPLLGIPGVWDANKNSEFYANTDYFRPLPQLKNDK